MTLLIITLLYLSLLTARISYMFTQERGWFNMFGKFREYLGIYQIQQLDGTLTSEANTEFGNLFKCYKCLSPYIATFFSILLIISLHFNLIYIFIGITLPFVLSMLSIKLIEM